MQAFESKYWQEGIDSKALLVCFLQKLPYLLLMGVTGAVLGSGLYLLIAVCTSEGTMYQAKTEYYIDFAEGRIDAKDYYNDFTWNTVMATDWILGNTMEMLGYGYDRNEVDDMITADILSDVRYLTITVEGADAELVGTISETTKLSLESLVSRVEKVADSIDSIEQIRNNGVQQIEEPLFTWRAAFLGAVCGILVYAFWIAASFCMGSRYYTKQAIMQSLGIPIFGLLYARNNEAEGVQEKALQLALKHQMEKEACKQVVFMDACGGKYAETCYENLSKLYTEEQLGASFTVQSFPIQKKEDYDVMRKTAGVVLTIPFGKSCREAVVEEINQLQNQECNILGVILVEVDRRWMKLYGIH